MFLKLGAMTLNTENNLANQDPYVNTIEAVENVSSETVSHNEIKKIRLIVKLRDGYEYITRIWLFDKSQQLVFNPDEHGTSEVMKQPDVFTRVFLLEVGDYTVRVDINGQVQDNKITLIEDKTVFINGRVTNGSDKLIAPDLYSSALLNGRFNYASSHKYYRAYAEAISTMNTLSIPVQSQHKSGLFIFLRFPSAKIYQMSDQEDICWKYFTLYDFYGRSIANFPRDSFTDKSFKLPNNISSSGFLGFSAELPKGLYFLEYKNPQSDRSTDRVIPIYIYENWFTQFFMTVVNDKPFFETIRTFISADRRFNPDDVNHTYVDICINKIQSKDFTIEEDLLRNIAYGKFESPMLGLLGCYIYLSGSETKDDHLFRTIVRNLQDRILKNSQNSPDIFALNFLSHEHFGKTINTGHLLYVYGTPTLRIAYDVLRKAASKYQWVIPEGTLNDFIAGNQYFDSTFNTFNISTRFFSTPNKSSGGVKLKEKIGATELQAVLLSVHNGLYRDNTYATNNLQQELDSPPLSEDKKNSDSDDLATEKVFQETGTSEKNSERNKNRLKLLKKNPENIGWIGVFIIDQLLINSSATTPEIAQKINMPINTISRIRRDWRLYV